MPNAEVVKNDGYQRIYRFANDYGASVVCGPYTYGGSEGLFELAVLRFSAQGWSITYETEITSDVIGHLTQDGVDEVLAKIEALTS